MHMQKNGQPSVALRHKIQAWMARWPLHSIHITNWILHRKNQIFVCQLGVGHFQCGHHPIFMCWPNEF